MRINSDHRVENPSAGKTGASGTPTVIDHCLVCGEEITEGTSYTYIEAGLICSEFNCMREVIEEQAYEIKELKEETEEGDEE